MIRAVSAAVPENFVENFDVRFVKATGVHWRPVCTEKQDALVLAHAAVSALPLYDGEPDAVICVTQTPPVAVPPLACSIAALVRAPRNALAFDVRQACDGYIYGLYLAWRTGLRRVLVVAGDATSKIADPEEPGTSNLFGDAMTATLWENTAREVDFPPRFTFGTDGGGFDYLKADPLLGMNGPEVFGFTLREVPSMVEHLRAWGEPEAYLFHQANGYLVRHLAKKCDIPETACVPTNIEKYGNTSSASIPLLLADSQLTPSIRSRPTRSALVAFGAGWSWAGLATMIGPISAKVVQVDDKGNGHGR